MQIVIGNSAGNLKNSNSHFNFIVYFIEEQFLFCIVNHKGQLLHKKVILKNRYLIMITKTKLAKRKKNPVLESEVNKVLNKLNKRAELMI